MKTCDGCRHAAWDAAPSTDGHCAYQWTMPPMPNALAPGIAPSKPDAATPPVYAFAAPQVRAIRRGYTFARHCVYHRRNEDEA